MGKNKRTREAEARVALLEQLLVEQDEEQSRLLDAIARLRRVVWEASKLPCETRAMQVLLANKALGTLGIVNKLILKKEGTE